MKSPISITVSILDPPVRMGKPCRLEVVVKNTGETPATVNSRLAVGYKNSLARELYAELIDVTAGKPALFYEADINRDFSGPQDYRVLQPGESFSTSFDLFDYYNPMKPGKFRLTIFYQADETLARFPETLLRGVFAGNSLDLEILPADFNGSSQLNEKKK